MEDYFHYVLAEIMFVKEMSKAKKEEVLKKWIESEKLPRKKKKAIRKRLKMQYEIFSFGESLFSK